MYMVFTCGFNTNNYQCPERKRQGRDFRIVLARSVTKLCTYLPVVPALRFLIRPLLDLLKKIISCLFVFLFTFQPSQSKLFP